MSKKEKELARVFEEVLDSNDKEILEHLDRQLSLLEELAERRKKERGEKK